MKPLYTFILLLLIFIDLFQTVYSQTLIKGDQFHVKGRHEIENNKVKYDFYVEMELSKFNIKQQPFTLSLFFDDTANHYNIIFMNSTQHEVSRKILYIKANNYSYPQTLTFSDLTQTQNLTLLIQKRTKSYVGGVVSFGGVKINNNEIEYIPQKYIPLVYENGKIIKNLLKIKFLGASVSCGMSLDREDCSGVINNGDASISFTTLTAKKLKALEHRLICRSGIGVCVGSIFEKMYVHTFEVDFIDLLYYNSRLWNFFKFIPDVVVINLGNNDYSALSKGEVDGYIKNYNNLLDLIISKYRPHNRNLKIVSTVGVLYGDNYQYSGITESIVKNRTEFNTTIFWKSLYHLGFDLYGEIPTYRLFLVSRSRNA
ncbi:hypothetical protein ABK040_004637 [Willaertia magna]